MIEPEMAFTDLKRNIQIAEAYLKFCIRHILQNCTEDLQFFQKQYDSSLLERLQVVTSINDLQFEYSHSRVQVAQ